MDLGLTDKTALVLGAGGGLGGAISKALAREGVKVAAADIAVETCQETVEQINAGGGTGLALEWDIADLSLIEPQVAKVEEAFGQIDILVNNTGGPPPAPAGNQDPNQWSKQFQSMVLCVIAITDRVLPSMRARKWGRVITSTSSGVVAPIPNLGLSNTLRASLVAWSKTLAREVGKDGVTSNIIIPGRIATGRTLFLDEQKAKREGRPVEEITSESCAAIPVGRYGDPQEYGDTVAFLASERASYINGSTIRVDGGYIPSI